MRLLDRYRSYLCLIEALPAGVSNISACFAPGLASSATVFVCKRGGSPGKNLRYHRATFARAHALTRLTGLSCIIILELLPPCVALIFRLPDGVWSVCLAARWQRGQKAQGGSQNTGKSMIPVTFDASAVNTATRKRCCCDCASISH